MQNPDNLEVYRRSMALAVCIHRLARRVPSRELPGMAGQIRRAAASIPANIAEGAGSDSPLVFARHLGIAIGSAFELETHLVLATQLVDRLTDISPILEETRALRRMMYRLRVYQLGKDGNNEPQKQPGEPVEG